MKEAQQTLEPAGSAKGTKCDENLRDAIKYQPIKRKGSYPEV